MLKQLLFIAACISLSANAFSQDKTHYIKGYFGFTYICCGGKQGF